MQQVKCQEECMQQTNCHLCNKPSVMTLEYMQQAKCQAEHMQQAKCYPCNKPSFTTHAKYIKCRDS